ncbi:MAG: hypothetical protein ACLFRZ_12650 [Rhodosalinus sp.]
MIVRGTAIFHALAVAFCLAGGAMQAEAQEVIGEVNATLDGTERQWQTLQSTESDISFNTGIRETGPITEIGIQGFEEGGSFNREVIVINWFVMDEGEPMDASVMYVPERMSQSWMSPEGEQVVNVEAFDGESASGTLKGRLCYKDGFAAPPDPDRCMEIDGTFETRLPEDS